MVTSTRSSGPTGTEFGAARPFVVEPVDGYRPGDGAKPMSKTKAPVTEVHAVLRSQATNGSMNAWYWFNGVRRMCDMSDRSGNKPRVRLM